MLRQGYAKGTVSYGVVKKSKGRNRQPIKTYQNLAFDAQSTHNPHIVAHHLTQYNAE